MNNNIIKTILLIFILFSSSLEAYDKFKCSLQCSGNTCRKDIKVLNYCAETCDVAKYQSCWESGLKTLQANPNLVPQQRTALMKLLKSYVRDSGNYSRGQNFSMDMRKQGY